MVSKCTECGSTKIELDPSRGDAICTSCGTVLSEHNIVSEIQFIENSKGGSSAIGQFISNDGLGKHSLLLRSFHGGIVSRESKQITLINAKKKIRGVVQQLRLMKHHEDTAFNFFKLGLSKGLTKGRKNSLIIGACIYITCRTESTAHMLIDVSDALQVDVYELGRTYLRLSKSLCITIPAIDPCLYILRFSYKLSFGAKTHKVSETALRLVKRMKRDWIHTGRRPSGLCGAALVIAARLHNFNRTIPDVIKVVKVHESTLRKRLTEFGETPSSALTPDEFMSVDLDEEQDPPAFKAAKKKEKFRLQMLIESNNNFDSEISEIQQEIEKHLNDRKKKLRGIWAKYGKEADNSSHKTGDKTSKLENLTIDESMKINKDKQLCKNNNLLANEDACTSQFIAESTIKTITSCLHDSEEEHKTLLTSIDFGIPPSAESLGLRDSIEDCMKVHPSKPKQVESGVLDLTGIDDDEIDSYIMSEREINLKTKLWMQINKEYLEEVKLKEEREQMEIEQREKDGRPPKIKKTYKKRQKNAGPASTAGEAIEKLIQDRKLSSKINYDVLRALDSSKSKINKVPMKNNLNSTNNVKVPVETPVEIKSILHSIAGKARRNSEGTETKKCLRTNKNSCVKKNKKDSSFKSLKQNRIVSSSDEE